MTACGDFMLLEKAITPCSHRFFPLLDRISTQNLALRGAFSLLQRSEYGIPEEKRISLSNLWLICYI
jgi:hypothetical protein